MRGIRYTNDFGRTSACYHSERILVISFECQFGFINLDLDAVLDGDDLIRTNLARNSLAGNRIPAPPTAVAQTIHARLVCLFHDLCHRAECFTFIADAQLAAINARITNCRDAVIFQFQTERDVQRLPTDIAAAATAILRKDLITASWTGDDFTTETGELSQLVPLIRAATTSITVYHMLLSSSAQAPPLFCNNQVSNLPIICHTDVCLALGHPHQLFRLDDKFPAFGDVDTPGVVGAGKN